jgi:alkanesulfonate monooxygenase SsuD/methylene tetrahydromethanopterin reductase-like flavin-dependent oxidoreductase (luciferase family)
MIGGAGAGSLRIAAKHATIWNVLGPPERCQERAAELERQCVASGRDFDEIELSLHMTLSLAPTHDEAVARAEAITAVFGQELAAIADNWLIGDPDELVRRLRSYTDLGFSDFVFGVGHPFDTTQLRLLAEEVLPRVGWSPAGAAAPAGT